MIRPVELDVQLPCETSVVSDDGLVGRSVWKSPIKAFVLFILSKMQKYIVLYFLRFLLQNECYYKWSFNI